MFRSFTLPDKSPCAVILRDHNAKRLSNTCFRGPNVHKSGNFCDWHNMNYVLNDYIVRMMLFDQVQDLVNIHDSSDPPGTQRLQIQMAHHIGWSSTDEYAKYSSNMLEPFNPNRHSSALRLRSDATHLKAPLTKLVTIVHTVHFELKIGWVIVIHTIYPGLDIGNLHGDITMDQGIVFFDWNHPGEPISL